MRVVIEDPQPVVATLPVCHQCKGVSDRSGLVDMVKSVNWKLVDAFDLRTIVSCFDCKWIRSVTAY